MLVYRWNLTEVYRKSTEHATGPMYLRNFRGISSISADYHRQYLAKNSDGYCGLGPLCQCDLEQLPSTI